MGGGVGVSVTVGGRVSVGVGVGVSVAVAVAVGGGAAVGGGDGEDVGVRLGVRLGGTNWVGVFSSAGRVGEGVKVCNTAVANAGSVAGVAPGWPGCAINSAAIPIT